MVFQNFKEEWFGNVRKDILAGAAVAFALIPEAIAFSMIAGVNPMIGLYGSFIIAIVVSIFGGRVGMISGATGSTALLMVLLVKNHGDQYLFAAGILAGLIQLGISVLKISRFITFVSRSVVIGFVNALAILIFMAQLPHVMGQGMIAYIICGVTVAIVWGLPFITKAIPSSLIAIFVITAVNMLFKLPVQTVGDIGHLQAHLPYFHIPIVPLDFHTLAVILPYSLPIALVGSLETLMTATVIDDSTHSKSAKHKEIRAQGIANMFTGFFGAMAGCAMVGQSMLNVEYGGRKRLSTFVSGAFLIMLIVVLRPIVSQIPVAALVGVMFMVSYYTFEWKSLHELGKVPVFESLVMVITVIMVVATNDLAIGVFAGVILNAVFIGWKMARIHATTTTSLDGVKTYTIKGQMFFATVTHFGDIFDVDHDPYEVVIDFRHTHVWDHASVMGIQKLVDKYDAFDKSITFIGLNEESLELMRKTGDDRSA